VCTCRRALLACLAGAIELHRCATSWVPSCDLADLIGLQPAHHQLAAAVDLAATVGLRLAHSRRAALARLAASIERSVCTSRREPPASLAGTIELRRCTSAWRRLHCTARRVTRWPPLAAWLATSRPGVARLEAALPVQITVRELGSLG
jgi:hypothetical protein